jgi:nitroreductase
MNSEIIKNMPPEAIALYKDRQGGREDFSMFYDAPTLILVSGEKDDDHTDSNCGYATQNICIAAQSLGVASIVIGMARFIFATPDADEYAKKLGVPDGYKPLYVICLGYAGTQPDAPKLIEGKVSYIR